MQLSRDHAEECFEFAGLGHVLLVEVKPYYNLNDFTGHCCLDYPYGAKMPDIMEMNKLYKSGEKIPADASAAFGINPSVTAWEMCHGAGGGIYSVEIWVNNWKDLWNEAGAIIQWNPGKVIHEDTSIWASIAQAIRDRE